MLLLIGECQVASINLTANVTYSKYNDPACFMEKVTFTCSIVGRHLLWFLNGYNVKTYNADDVCGTFTQCNDVNTNHCINYAPDFLLASNIPTEDCASNRSDCFYECTSLMTITANISGHVTIKCVTMDRQNNRNATNSSSFEVLGM